MKKTVKARRTKPPADYDDNPPWSAADFKRARPAREVVPELVEAFKRARGRPPLENPKISLTLRLDKAMVEKFRASGPGWQGRMNATLIKAAPRAKKISP
jgi:uncharacterized protein (DUF4415 family)